MSFKLSRQVINQEVIRIVSREMKKQKVKIASATACQLKEIAHISEEISLHELPRQYVRRKLPNELGFGIFLHPDAQPILKGQVIAPYAGEVTIVPESKPDDASYAFAPFTKFHLMKEEQNVFDSQKNYHPRRLYSLKLDAEKQGNFTRYINHSEKPNIEAHSLIVKSNKYGLAPASIEIVYMAKKTIHPGEQLLISYEDGEKSYWGASGITPFRMTPKTFRLSQSLKVVSDIKE